MGEAFAAGGAPGGPEVDEDDFAFLFGKGEGGAVHEGDGEVFGGLADADVVFDAVDGGVEAFVVVEGFVLFVVELCVGEEAAVDGFVEPEEGFVEVVHF